MPKDDLLTFLTNQTDFFNPRDVSEVFTASYLAQRFGMQRNTASHYLNQWVAQGLLIKINTRPVYFLHKASFEQQFYPLTCSEYASIDALLDDAQAEPETVDHFSLLIGHNGSLKKAVEQLKTALLYPGGGLPLLISGDSGTGKSYMAQLLHQYAIAQGIIDADAPFVTFNCAKYAHNPELLASNLFGYVRGAFTGAAADKTGAFEAADGGMLFLDEVHRLDAEGQEKLFTWLDRGEIYRVGETANGRPVSARLIFATTEEIHSTFLTTFLRRIPIQVALPTIAERNLKEREALILQFFWSEAQKVGRGLRITPRLLGALMYCVYRGNVGELKNVVRYSVACAFAHNPQQGPLRVTLHHLPDSVLTRLPQSEDEAASQQDVILEQGTSLHWLLDSRDENRVLIHDVQLRVLALFEKYRQGAAAWSDVESLMSQDIENLFDRLIFDNRSQNGSQTLQWITSQLRDEFYRLERHYSLQFNGNGIYAIGHYLLYRPALAPRQLKAGLCQQFDDFLQQKYPQLYPFCLEVLDCLSRKLDLSIQPMDASLLILWLHKMGVQRSALVTRAVILAHGYATASSIASVANRLLKQPVFESFDMPLDVTPQEIAREVSHYIERNALSSGLVILVDMGSLSEIHHDFSGRVTTPVAIFNNVSTGMALYVGERLLQGDYLENIAQDIGRDLPVEHQIIWPQRNKPRAIITTCATGMGAASNLCHLLKASIPAALGIEVVACEYDALVQNKRREPIFNRFEVLALVGTVNPRVADIPWVSLESMISGHGAALLNPIFGALTTPEGVAEINNAIVKHFSLRRVIESVTILDTGKVIDQVEQFLMRYEHPGDLQIANDKKVALYIHISCLIERLIRQASVENYSGRGECQRHHLDRLREAFSVIEASYSVKIPDSELFYVHDILHSETEFLQYDQEF
ncbi:sigma 54-interacting transcriptional regulator [Enterobacteriaceae bacterium BIT-l23]|uniref:sigma 54-interacting transcriptional regulator n=1 Tax=Jejubacter sp. L23 TaxID=3092086 RepID=UPI0015850034|nr:sigma 54-interacting transcriptional regulator [Enterobacteriaceae bacterium BIT-l23]